MRPVVASGMLIYTIGQAKTECCSCKMTAFLTGSIHSNLRECIHQPFGQAESVKVHIHSRYIHRLHRSSVHENPTRHHQQVRSRALLQEAVAHSKSLLHSNYHCLGKSLTENIANIENR